MTALWYPDAIRRLGPPHKVYAVENMLTGAVLHSMVGPLSAAFGELDRASRQASWHFSVAKAGLVYQHYPLTASTWHCGSPHWNQRLVGIEHEGGPVGNESEPLTTAQREASVRLVRWIARECGWSRLERRVTLWEHNEVSPADRPTACPSGRIPWAAYTAEEEPMSNAYIVARGDTLGAIAQRFGTTVSKLAQINAIADPNRIEVGQVLRLDDAAPLPINLPLVHAVKAQLATATAAIDQARAVLDRGTP